jgi:hypothetical protein
MAPHDGVEAENYARECVRLANQSADPAIRERLFQMAREWMAVAMHEEKTPEANRAARAQRPPSADLIRSPKDGRQGPG